MTHQPNPNSLQMIAGWMKTLWKKLKKLWEEFCADPGPYPQ